jgi:hypothetical protein
LQNEYDYNLHAKNIEEKANITLYEEKSLFDGKKEIKKGEKFVLKPNPIMRLDRVIGWHPNYTQG